MTLAIAVAIVVSLVLVAAATTTVYVLKKRRGGRNRNAEPFSPSTQVHGHAFDLKNMCNVNFRQSD